MNIVTSEFVPEDTAYIINENGVEKVIMGTKELTHIDNAVKYLKKLKKNKGDTGLSDKEIDNLIADLVNGGLSDIIELLGE